MKFLSVCSGIEAASVAWNPLGWEAAAFSEIEPFPCAVLAHHYPSVPNLGDMTKFQEWPDVAIDLLCGGTPCQSFSVAGLRKGLDDPRGNLMLTFGAIAAKYRPKWLVWENVPGVLSSNGGRDFGAFLGMLGELGYGFAYRVLDAQFFGVPQRRRRVFVVGCAGDWRSAAAVLFERHSLSGHPAPRREAGQAAPTIPSRRTAGGGLGTDFDCDGGLIQAFGGNDTRGPIDVATARNACASASGRMDFESETFLTVATLDASYGRLQGASGQDANHGHRHLIAFSAKDHGADAQNDISPTLRAGGHAGSHANAGVMPAIAFKSGQSEAAGGAFVTEEYSPTLQAQNNGSTAVPAVLTAMQVRRLTPRECARLQGFPDDYLDILHRGKPAADGPKYKALGNSWAVPCVRWIGQRIAAVESLAQLKEAA